MASIESNAAQRVQNACVKKTYTSRIRKALLRRWRRRKHPHVKDINPHLARDIGLGDTDFAQHQHRWPSQTTHHPRG